MIMIIVFLVAYFFPQFRSFLLDGNETEVSPSGAKAMARCAWSGRLGTQAKVTEICPKLTPLQA
jgi:hypothetical protein